MKKSRISTSIISLALLSSLLLGSIQATAQSLQQNKKVTSGKNTTKQQVQKAAVSEKSTATAPKKEKEIPFYQGTTIGVDIYGLGNKLLGGDFTSTEVSVEINLKNRYVPVVEIGYGSTNTTDDETDIHYKASAPYFRAGMNYNFFFRKPHLPGYLYGGARLGYTSFKYDVNAPEVHDPNWGTPNVPFHYEGVKTNVAWGELLAGVKVQVHKAFYMGWSVRYRMRLSMKKGEHTEPWYIPGFGKNKSTNLGITYNLIYKLPF